MTDFTPKTPEQEVIRAGQARQIIESAMWQEARAHIDETLKAQRLAVPLREVEMHTRLIICDQVWQKLQDFFQEIADSGRLAELQIQQKRSLADRMAAPFRR